MFQYEARIIRVVDGDTLIVNVDLGFRIRIEQTVRLARVNAPEIVNWGAQGLNDPAVRFIHEVCPFDAVVVLNTIKSEKYGRWLAEVLFSPGEDDRTQILLHARNLSDELLEKGLVKPYLERH